MKIAIIGASISGLAAATILLKQGHQVMIFEQYPDGLKNQGAGIVIPVELFDGLQKQNILDHNISTVNICKRNIICHDKNNARIICEQNGAGRTLHWQTLYTQLKANVPDNNINMGQRVTNIDELRNSENFDLIVGADGHNSLTAKSICSDIHPEYAGYIAWRGTVPKEDCLTNGIFGSLNESISPYFVYPSGHCIMYLIQEPQTNKTLINWVLYEKRDPASLQKLLSINPDTNQYQTMSRGHMQASELEYLHTFIKVLPKLAQDIITRTKEPFIQPIYTIKIPQRINLQGNVVLIGDAAGTLPPHTASGAAKGIGDALQIAMAIKNDGLEGIKKWAQTRIIEDNKLYALSDRMKHFLVLNTPDWHNMTAEKFEEIWAKVLAGEAWYYIEKAHESALAKPKL